MEELETIEGMSKQELRHLTHDVLPNIRKTGAYISPEKFVEMLDNPDTLNTLIEKLKEIKSANGAQ